MRTMLSPLNLSKCLLIWKGHVKTGCFEYNLANIPDDFERESDDLIDSKVMNTLFKMGREMAREGGLWRHHPPGFTS
ncbi:MAG: hypothetical protein ACOCWR_11230 [Oceanidesulfovibrio sp.]